MMRGFWHVSFTVSNIEASVKWYTDMVRYKEDRHTLTETDLSDMFVRNG